ncbi:GGDEF domain-containing response regulator [Gynuella sunshinyii]|uniref:GGDEF domain-containing response regulator n=1 Tax=Gynuella sunshinyii TaxID=1445505 RepID=UPI0009E4D34E|nr:diguanylate cyclase [Gynuella sunshinyii]
MQILVVEDSSTLRAGMKTMIASLGHSAVFAKSGEEALQMVGSLSIDMIIMDIELPGLDGYETTMLFREALCDHWVPIIFVTGNSSDESVLKAIDAGGDDYLVKPVSQTLLQAKIIAMQRIADMQANLHELNRKLSEQSETDPLTGLSNRRYFNLRAVDQFETARRMALSVAIMMMDIDQFKVYNDNYGHLQGDSCLQQVSRVLKSVVRRTTDLVARFGGEEFIIMLQDCDAKGAQMIADEIMAAIDQAAIPHEYSAVSDHVTLSIGVCVIVPDRNLVELQDCIKIADEQLYKAKNRGRAQAVIEQSNKMKTTLIVSREPETIKSIGKVLNSKSIIITSSDQEECNEIITQVHPDIVICDIRPETGIVPDDLSLLMAPDRQSDFIVVELSSGAQKSYPDQNSLLSDSHMLSI